MLKNNFSYIRFVYVTSSRDKNELYFFVDDQVYADYIQTFLLPIFKHRVL